LLTNSVALKGALERIHGDRFSCPPIRGVDIQDDYEDDMHYNHAENQNEANTIKCSKVWDNYDDSYTDAYSDHQNYDPVNDDAF